MINFPFYPGIGFRWFLFLWAGLTLLIACNVGWFIVTADANTALDSPPEKGKVGVLLVFCILLLMFHGLGIRRHLQLHSLQRTLSATWSKTAMFLWFLLILYMNLVFYPIPPRSHHLDKLLPFVIGSLIWVLFFVFWPISLREFLNSRIYQWIKIVLINVLVFVLIGEIGFRILDPWLALGGLFGDKQTPAFLTPHLPAVGSIGHTNSQGFRDKERSLTRQSGAPRIVALGDSFTYGVGVIYDETFTALIERELQEPFPGTEIINLGVPGWETITQFHLLKTYGIRFRPDMVMLNFFVGNDILRRRGMDHEEGMLVAGRSYYIHKSDKWIHDTISPDRFFLYHNLRYVLKMGSRRLRGVSILEEDNNDPYDVWVSLLSPDGYLKEIEQRSDNYLIPETNFFSSRWTYTEGILNEMREFLEARGVSLVIVALPAQEQVDTVIQKKLLTVLRATSDSFEWEKPQRHLRAWCKENGVPLIDLFRIFKDHDDPSGLFLKNDLHYNQGGHKLAAKGILPELKTMVSNFQH